MLAVLFALAAATLPADTVRQGADRPVRGLSGDFDPARFAGRAPPPRPPSPLLTPANLNRAMTAHYIERYTAPNGVAWLHSVIRNGHTFIPFVRAEAERQGLPPELVFVPFIESEYIGTALSRSGAAGLWQFMLNSVEPFGLRVDGTVDERRDFRRATTAALRKLEGHYRAFGCWPMAFAAYNMGPNGLRRAAQAAGTFDYWELSGRGAISRETSRFVPRIVAVSYVLSNARRFGVDWWPSGVDWTAVIPAGPVNLDALAAGSGLDPALLRRLNLELLHGVTGNTGRKIVIPASHTEPVMAFLARSAPVFARYHRYTVRPGDTLYAIARHYGVPVAAIERHNSGVTARVLRPGETLVIPLEVLSATPPVPFTAAAPVTAAQPVARQFSGTHVVVSGDTLWSLARRHGTTAQELAAANGMGVNQTLSVGRALRVPIME